MTLKRGGADAFLSPEAKAVLASVKPARFSGIELNAATAQFIRAAARQAMEARIAPLAARARGSFTATEHSGVATVAYTPTEAAPSPRRVLYLHGGAFIVGEAQDAGAYLLAELFNAPLVSVAYRLAPEHPFPAALDDCLAVYRALVANDGAKGLFVVGMSAGAALAASMIRLAIAEGLPTPDSLVLLTPGADLAAFGDSLDINDGRDPILTWEDQLDKALSAYVGAADPADPLISPARATYTPDFPRTLIVSGTRDVLLSPCVRLYWAMRNGGAPADLRIWDGMWHAFTFDPNLPEAHACLAEIASFVGEAGSAQLR